MTSIITLEDCVFESQQGRIQMVLPSIIDLGCAVPSVGVKRDYHRHYPNEHGDLVVACDYVARFFRLGDRINRLRSEKAWPEDLGNTFYFDRWPEIERQMESYPSAHAGDMVLGIPELRCLASQFLRWTNEFMRLY